MSTPSTVNPKAFCLCGHRRSEHRDDSTTSWPQCTAGHCDCEWFRDDWQRGDDGEYSHEKWVAHFGTTP